MESLDKFIAILKYVAGREAVNHNCLMRPRKGVFYCDVVRKADRVVVATAWVPDEIQTLLERVRKPEATTENIDYVTASKVDYTADEMEQMANDMLVAVPR